MYTILHIIHVSYIVNFTSINELSVQASGTSPDIWLPTLWDFRNYQYPLDSVRYYIKVVDPITDLNYASPGDWVGCFGNLDKEVSRKPYLLGEPSRYIDSYEGFIVSCYGLNGNVQSNTVRLKYFRNESNLDTILIRKYEDVPNSHDPDIWNAPGTYNISSSYVDITKLSDFGNISHPLKMVPDDAFFTQKCLSADISPPVFGSVGNTDQNQLSMAYLRAILLEGTYLNDIEGRLNFYHKYPGRLDLIKWALYCFDRRRKNQISITDIVHVSRVMIRQSNIPTSCNADCLSSLELYLPCLSGESIKMNDITDSTYNVSTYNGMKQMKRIDFPLCQVYQGNNIFSYIGNGGFAQFYDLV